MSRAHSDADLRATLEAVKAAGGSRRKAASALGVSESTLKTRLQVARQRGLDVPAPPSSAGALGSVAADRLGRISELLERSGIPLEEIGRVERIRLKAWQGLTKGEDGSAVVTDMHGEGLDLVPRWADGPAWPVIAQAPAVTISPVRVNIQPVRAAGWRVAVVLPDIQIGWYVGRDGRLVPTHDEAALSVALQVARDADPDQVVLVGDNLDLPELSRYRKMPAFQRTTQASIDRAGRFAAELRSVVRPECPIIWIAGNHEERLPNYIVDNAAAAFGLKRANAPASWPVLSVPFLCRFDEHDITFLPGYPASSWWINESLQVVHGNKVRTGGSTAHAYLPEIRHSVIYGHVHRREFAAVTRLTRNGPRTYHAACFGALCRIDGSVPGAASGYDLDGLPIASVENWQQGLGVVEYQEGDGDFAMEAIEIWNGRARWRGKSYHAPDDITEAA